MQCNSNTPHDDTKGGTALFRSDTAFENNPDHEPEEKPVHKTKKNKGVALQGLGGGEGELELVGGAGFEGEEEEEVSAGGVLWCLGVWEEEGWVNDLTTRRAD